MEMFSKKGGLTYFTCCLQDFCHGIGMVHDSSCLFYFLMLSGGWGGLRWEGVLIFKSRPPGMSERLPNQIWAGFPPTLVFINFCEDFIVHRLRAYSEDVF
jgi:hypothetical protein